MRVTSGKSQNNGGCVAVWRTACDADASCVEWASPAASAVSNCVQRTVPCQGGECVELCACGQDNCGLVHVRDSKDPAGVVLDYPENNWDGGRAVHFLPVSRTVVAQHAPQILAEAARRGHDPLAHWYQVCPSLVMTWSLWFDQAEADAWLTGVAAGEFTLEDA